MINLGLSAEQETRAAELHANMVTWDMLIESTVHQQGWDNMAVDGGPTGGSFTVGAGGLENMGLGDQLPRTDDWWSYHTTLDDIARLHGVFASSDNKIVQAKCVADIEQAQRDGTVAIMLNTQNSIWAGYDFDRIVTMYNLGLRVVQLTYNQQNFVGSGCQEDSNNKLSEFGKQFVEKLNEQGMLVDTGHTGAGTIKHAIDVSNKPIACSHAGLAVQAPGQDRVQTDQTLKYLADNGGVFGLSAIPGMLTGNLKCTVNEYVDGFEHAIKVMGIDHVGIGFMFAPTHHGATRHAVGPRREIGVRTIFNLLGPLTNPAAARWQLVGVYEQRWLRPRAEVFGNLGSIHTLVVSSSDGLDEISIADSTPVCEFYKGKLSEFVISPEDYGIERQALSSIKVESASESLALIHSALSGEKGPAYDMVALNAGATLYAADVVISVGDGVDRARAVLDAGDAVSKLEELASYTQRFG